MNILKWLVLVGLVVTNTFQFFMYRSVKRNWRHYIPVRATITSSKLIDQLNTDGGRDYQAEIRFKYLWDGEEHESDTAILRGPQLFPLWNYEHSLLQKYKEGDYCEARVHPQKADIAFLELAPLSKKSAILLPLLTIGYAAAIVAWTLLLTSRD